MPSVAVIGLGRIAWQLELDPLRYKPCTHIGAIIAANQFLKKNQRLTIDYLCDHDQEKLKACQLFLSKSFLTQNYQKPYQKDLFSTTDYQKIIALKPDVVVIATDTIHHTPILLEAVKNNIEHIVVEKPLAQDHHQLQALHKALKNYGGRVYINYERRRHSNYLQLKKMLEQNSVGRPLFYRGILASKGYSFDRTRVKHASGGKSFFSEGMLLHDTTHLVDVVQFLFGAVKSHRYQKHESSHSLLLEHGEVRGEITTLKDCRYFQFELEVYTSLGHIKIGNGYFEIQKSQKSTLYKNFYQLGSAKSLVTKTSLKDNPFVKLYLEVAHGRQDRQHINDALDNVKILITD